jgi:hypothetical protein
MIREIELGEHKIKLYPGEKLIHAGRIRIDNTPYLAVLLSRDGREILEFHRLEEPFTVAGWEIYRPSDETIRELEKIGFEFSESFKKRRVRELLPGKVIGIKPLMEKAMKKLAEITAE